MATMHIIRGLPGSGKSTLAKDIQKNINLKHILDPDYNEAVICSTDDIVSAQNTYLWSSTYLGLAHELNKQKVREACRRDLDVIVDNTNITTQEIQPYFDTAEEFGYEFQLHEATTEWAKCPVECFRRNTHNVPLKTIEKMLSLYHSNEKVMLKLKHKDIVEPFQPHQEYLPCIICDLDGTLCDHTGIRSPYDGSKCILDKCIQPVATILDYFHAHKYVILMSGREDQFREKTMQWLDIHDIKYNKLLMRTTGDNRRDSIVKLELFNLHVRNYFNPLFVIDDRLQVIRECWNQLGLFVLNVNQNLKEF
jgi:adenylate kinase family enzyme